MKLYLPKHTYHRWHQFMSDKHWCQKKREEIKTIQELWEEKLGVILTAKDGVAMFAFDKQDYLNKAQDL